MSDYRGPIYHVKTEEKFGDFTVYHYKGLTGTYAEAPRREFDNWCVELPHQCEEWEIADASSKEEALAAMEAFVANANQALEALREME